MPAGDNISIVTRVISESMLGVRIIMEKKELIRLSATKIMAKEGFCKTKVQWKLCEKNHLSYELVLSIYQIEGDNNTQIDNIKAKIGKLAYYRDYWAEQGYRDEIVFDLMLLSEQRGIE